MRIRSALLGSAAALMVVSSANAVKLKTYPLTLDTNPPLVGLEAEPKGPVQVASVYGPGYFYIPGMETALKISGYVSSDLSFGKDVALRRFSLNNDAVAHDYGYGARGSIALNSSTETRYGPLTSYVEIRGLYLGSQGSPTLGSKVELHHAYFELGGLRVGADDSIFSYWTNYYGGVLNDNILDPMAYATTNAVSYTFNAGNGVSAIVGLEQGGRSPDYGLSAIHYVDGKGEPFIIGGNSKNKGKIPNIVAGIKYGQGWGGISAVAAYDTGYNDWAGKLRLDGNLNDRLNVWVMGGYKNGKDAYIADGKPVPTATGTSVQPVYRALNSIYGDWGGKWEIVGGAGYKLTPAAVFNAQIGYDALKTKAASVDVAYSLRPDLVFIPELTYVSWNNDISKDAGKNFVDSLNGKNAVQVLVHVKHTF